MSSAVVDLPLREDLRLAIDLGGSTLRMVVCDRSSNVLRSEKIAYPQDRFDTMGQSLEWFLNDLGYRPAFAVVGAAGPIEKGRRVKLTNNPKWPVFDADVAEKEFGIRFHLVNDLIIAAAAIPKLTDDDVDVVRYGIVDTSGPSIVVTLSTGVNDALCLPDIFGPLGYLPAEAGHTPFAPRSNDEIELLRWLMEGGMEYVTFESIIAGSQGVTRVYEFVTQKLGIAPLESTLAAFREVEHIGPVLTKVALEDRDPAALKVLEIVGGATGSYLSARAIATLATGGIYLVGSISTNDALMKHYAEHTPFMERFENAGVYSRLLKDITILRILRPEFGLLGASTIAAKLE